MSDLPDEVEPWGYGSACYCCISRRTNTSSRLREAAVNKYSYVAKSKSKLSTLFLWDELLNQLCNSNTNPPLVCTEGKSVFLLSDSQRLSHWDEWMTSRYIYILYIIYGCFEVSLLDLTLCVSSVQMIPVKYLDLKIVYYPRLAMSVAACRWC